MVGLLHRGDGVLVRERSCWEDGSHMLSPDPAVNQ